MANETKGSRDGLATEVGTEEMPTLHEAIVKIIRAEFKKVGTKNTIKLSLFCEHPERTDGLIELSNVKQITDNKIMSVGLWKNEDSQGKIRKGSALANFLIFMDCKTPLELEGKQVQTVLDGKYLVIKGYK